MQKHRSQFGAQCSVGMTLGEEDSRRVKKRFYWPTQYMDVKNYYKACEECQKCSPGRGTTVPLVPLPIMTEPFQHIAIDVAGTLPSSQMGNNIY